MMYKKKLTKYEHNQKVVTFMSSFPFYFQPYIDLALGWAGWGEVAYI